MSKLQWPVQAKNYRLTYRLLRELICSFEYLQQLKADSVFDVDNCVINKKHVINLVDLLLNNRSVRDIFEFEDDEEEGEMLNDPSTLEIGLTGEVAYIPDYQLKLAIHRLKKLQRVLC